jgi:hypothetical protein
MVQEKLKALIRPLIQPQIVRYLGGTFACLRRGRAGPQASALVWLNKHSPNERGASPFYFLIKPAEKFTMVS